MKIDTTLFSVQVNVPHSECGNSTHLMPDELIDWLRSTLALSDGEFVDYHYCGGGSWGDGTTNGVTNHESVYMVNNIQETDALAFQIMFPKCKVYVSKQYDFSMV